MHIECTIFINNPWGKRCPECGKTYKKTTAHKRRPYKRNLVAEYYGRNNDGNRIRNICIWQ